MVIALRKSSEAYFRYIHEKYLIAVKPDMEKPIGFLIEELKKVKHIKDIK